MKAVSAKLICAFGFTNADCWFSHDAAQIHLICLSSVFKKIFPALQHHFSNDISWFDTKTNVDQTGTGVEWLSLVPEVPGSILSRGAFLVVALSMSHFHSS